jgi:TonB-linked SusC/RagA family outer membrane protein
MKSKLLRQVIAMSKITLFGMIIQCILYGAMIAGDLNAQNLDKSIQDIYITMDKTKAPIGEVLNQIERETGFIFAYNIDKVDLSHQIMINGGKSDLATVLMQISKESNLKFKRVNNNIHIGVRKKNESLKIEERINEQERTITGRVVSSEDNSGLPGVNVIVQGTGTGTITDIEGNYAIQVTDGAVLEFSSVGFNKEVVEVGMRTVIDISLMPDITQLSEIVVIGYGTREKKDLTGSIAQIGSKELNNEVKMAPELALQGKMAGVFVSNPGSDPLARPVVRIRGVSTLGFNDPLFVVDGVPLYEGGASSGSARDQDIRGNVNVLNMINPNDIESISVLKDASATAIYGVRASNGVILIQTKRGKEGKTNINFSGSFGVQNIKKRYDVLPTSEYASLFREAYDNNINEGLDDNDWGDLFDPASSEYLGNSPTYNWMDAATVNNAKIQDYNLSVTGGNAKSNYAVGAGFASQENAMFYSKFDRYSFNVNSDHKINNWLKVGETYRLVYSKTQQEPGTNVLDASLINPWQPLYDPNGLNGYALPGREINGEFETYGYGNSTRSNFLGASDYNWDERELLRNLGSLYAEISPVAGLRFRGTLSFDIYRNFNERFTMEDEGYFNPQRGAPNPDGTTYRTRANENRNIVLEFLIGYQKSFGNHNIDVIVNAMDQKMQWNNQQASANQTGLLDWDQRRIEEGWPPETKGLFYERSRFGLIGYMGRVSYNYNSKYYLDVTVRRDGTSRFGPGYKWGTFPSAGAAWRISSEDFMSGTTWLNDLKLRVGWGQTGNQETRDFAYLSLVNFNPKYALGSSGNPGEGIVVPAIALGDFPVVDMSWETVTTQNYGFDALFLKNKLSLTAEYYFRETEGILQAIQIPKVIGALNNPVVNLATVQNKGFEFVVGYNDQIGDLGINANLNFTTVDNKVTKLYENIPQGGESNRIEVGYPINFIRGYKVGGIYQTQQEVDSWLESNSDPGFENQKAAGDIYFQDLYGPPAEDALPEDYRTPGADGVINVYDQVYIGKQIPGYFYGLNMGLNYKQFDLAFTFRGLGDVQAINGVRRSGEQMSTGGVNYLAAVRERWTSQNPSTTMPRAVSSDPSGNNRMSDRWVEDAGFLRLQNAQLGYNFRGAGIEKAGISNMRLFLSMSNLFVMSPYTGLDPENDTTPMTFVVGFNFGL